MHPYLIALVLLVLGFVLGPWVAQRSAVRSGEQPLVVLEDEEIEVVGGVLHRPSAMAALWELKGSDFEDIELGELWEEMRSVIVETVGKVSITSERDVKRVGPTFPASLIEKVHYGDLGERAMLRSGALTDAELLVKGAAVLNAQDDRGRLAGVGVIERGGEGEKAWVRRPTPVSSLRKVCTGLILGLQGLAIPFLVDHLHFSTAGGIFAGISLVILALVGTEVALVDFDTFYIDQKVFWWGALAVWVFTVLALLTEGTPGRLWAGTIVLAAAALFEGSNWVYKKVRGGDGMGMGDTQLLFATAGIPAALTGSYALGWYSVLGGLLAGIVGWTIQRVRGKVTRTTPFAFGPYMVMGWVLAWVAVVAGWLA